MSNPANELCTTAGARYLVVARHGERLDYVSRDAGNPWTPTATHPYDPPLTDHGKQQAHKLGSHLRQEMIRRGIPPVTAVYSSPFLRCRQTSVEAAKGLSSADSNNLFIGVEFGLSESFNEQWYRSWALPGTDGTWGFKLPHEESTGIDPATLHPWSKEPIQKLPLFSHCLADGVTPQVDAKYKSQTTIDIPYTFDPRQLETRDAQCERMKATVNAVTQEGHTVMVTSHGAPVTHLFEALTGQPWKNHGRSVYCCYSLYRQNPNGQWEALAVNQSRYLDERLEGDNYVAMETE